MACPDHGTSVITFECLDKNWKLETNDKVSYVFINYSLLRYKQDKTNLSVFKTIYTLKWSSSIIST